MEPTIIRVKCRNKKHNTVTEVQLRRNTEPRIPRIHQQELVTVSDFCPQQDGCEICKQITERCEPPTTRVSTDTSWLQDLKPFPEFFFPDSVFEKQSGLLSVTDCEKLRNLIFTRTLNMFTLEPSNTLLTGSSREGFDYASHVDSTSDQDIMYVYAVLTEQEVDNFINYSVENPGYVTIDIHDAPQDHEIHKIFTTLTGHSFLDPAREKEKFRESLVSFSESHHKDLGCSFFEQGDNCAAISYTRSISMNRRFESFDNVDCVLSIACKGWPSICNAWKTRKRYWPSQQIIQNITKQGFHIVPKASCEDNINKEWRISFSVAELMLMDEITKEQKNLFISIKALFKETITCITGVFSSYHLKTMFLWACKTYPSSFWSHENVKDCIYVLIDNIIHAVVSAKLLHYFIPESNLLDNVSTFSLNNLAKLLLQLRQNISVGAWKWNVNNSGLLCALATIQLASAKREYNVLQTQLTSKFCDPVGDMMLTRISLPLTFISDMTSMACKLEHLEILQTDSKRLIETALDSFFYYHSMNQSKLKETAQHFSRIVDLTINGRGHIPESLNLHVAHIPELSGIQEVPMSIALDFLIKNCLNDHWNRIQKEKESSVVGELVHFLNTTSYILATKPANFEHKEFITEQWRTLRDIVGTWEPRLNIHELAELDQWEMDTSFDINLTYDEYVTKCRSNERSPCDGFCFDRRYNAAKEFLLQCYDRKYFNFLQVLSEGHNFTYVEGLPLRYPSDLYYMLQEYC